MNVVCLTGRLTRDPELRYTPSGIAVANFNLAVSRDYKNNDGVVEADFVPVFCWRKLAENSANYLIKGQEAEIEGRLKTRSYEDGEKKRFVMEVEATKIKFGNKPKDAKNNTDAAADTNQEYGFEEFAREVDLSDDIPF